jgi:hypothetical protein
VKSENDIYARTVRRVTWLILGLGVAGAIALGVNRGWKFGGGFLIGAGLSYVSFWRWRRVADAMGGTPGPRSVLLMLLRLALLIAVAYGIIRILMLSPAAVFLGLLVAGASVIVSLIIELIYART